MDYRSQSQSNLSNNDTVEPKLTKTTSHENTPKIDKEHVTLEKIFRITLNPDSSQYFYLEEYHAILMSIDDESKIRFSIGELESVLLSYVFSVEEVKKNILQYLLVSYHRAIVMIERKNMNEYDKSYLSIRKIISRYISLFLTNSEGLFPVEPDVQVVKKEFEDFFRERDVEEVEALLDDLGKTVDDADTMTRLFHPIWGTIYTENVGNLNKEKKVNFYNYEPLKKNIELLIRLFNKNHLIMRSFCLCAGFLPKLQNQQVLTGRSLQMASLMSSFYNLSPFEESTETLAEIYHQNTRDYRYIFAQVEETAEKYTKQLNIYLGLLEEFTELLLFNINTRNLMLKWLYAFISANQERTKIFYDKRALSSTGILLNIFFVLLKVLFDKHQINKTKNNMFKLIQQLEPLYIITTSPINFNHYDRVNPDVIKEYLATFEIDVLNDNEFNDSTILFFILHILESYFIKTVDDEYSRACQRLSELIREKEDDKIRTKIKQKCGIIGGYEVYLKNVDLVKELIKFSEVTSIFILMLNNKKYNSNTLITEKEFDYFQFVSDFAENINLDENLVLSTIPQHLIKNVVTNNIMIRKNIPEILVSESASTKLISYFAIIYSSNVELVKNPHLRSEIFDILNYFLIIYPYEKNVANLLNILNDHFVRGNLIYSIMRVFNDAERLGTSNQFYEKFHIRYKILNLIENIQKTHKTIYLDKIVEYTIDFPDDCTKTISCMMTDLNYFNEECIERLAQIKKYQELVANKDAYEKLDEETKKMEEDKFKEHDRLVKNELRLFNTVLNFMVMISKICQKSFMSYKLAERLANLLNYSLDIFVSPNGLKLKINNMKEYGFDPRFVLKSLVSIYASFIDYNEFLEYVVKDVRSYKISNFERVLNIANRGKATFNFDDLDAFYDIINKLKEIENFNRENEISYEDAEDEFIDPITSEIMDDPVLLPTSKQVVDRATIETILLSEALDPFNRSKLTKEDLQPCEELKKRIEEYKSKKKEEKQKAK